MGRNLKKKKTLSLGGLQIIHLLGESQMQISFLKKVWLLYRAERNESIHESSFYKIFKTLLKKEILTPLGATVSVSPQGERFLRYIFPFKPSLKGELILVSPQQAAEETGFALSTVQKQKAPFCYLSVGGRLHIIKKEPTDKVKELFPNFPLIHHKQLKEYLRLPYYLYLELRSVPYFMDDNKEFFIWDLVFFYLLKIGKTNFKSYKKIGLEEVPYEVLNLPKPEESK